MKALLKPTLILCCMHQLSCNKHEILDQEREKLDSERLRVIAEMGELDKKILALPDAYNLNVLEKQAEDLEKKAVDLEAQAKEKMLKWEGIEDKFIPLKKEAEDFKARNSK